MMVLAGPAQALLRLVSARVFPGAQPAAPRLAQEMMDILLHGVGRSQGRAPD